MEGAHCIGGKYEEGPDGIHATKPTRGCGLRRCVYPPHRRGRWSPSRFVSPGSGWGRMALLGSLSVCCARVIIVPVARARQGDASFKAPSQFSMKYDDRRGQAPLNIGTAELFVTSSESKGKD